MTVNTKKIIITSLILVGLIIITAFVFRPSGGKEVEVQEQKPKYDTALLYGAANKLLREKGSSIPYDRPMELQGDPEIYDSHWVVATIVLLDENPENSYDREMVYVFRGEESDIKAIAAEPSGWFTETQLPTDAPDELISRVLGEPHNEN